MSLITESLTCEATKAISYCTLVREAHALAELLKRVKPQLQDQVSELQCIVTRAHHRLEELDKQARDIETLDIQEARKTVFPHSLTSERTAVLSELQSAHHALRALKHRKQVKSKASGCHDPLA